MRVGNFVSNRRVKSSRENTDGFNGYMKQFDEMVSRALKCAQLVSLLFK